jgi:Uma2 family endonuclease
MTCNLNTGTSFIGPISAVRPESVPANRSLISSMHPGMFMIAAMQPDLVRRHRLTVEEYFRMAEVGLLAREARVELIEGEIIDMAPIGHRHTSVVSGLHDLFARELADQATVWDQGTLRLSASSAPQPDLMLLKYRKDKYRRSAPLPGDVLLIVEVSERSLRHDENVKVSLYARHNIPEVWIVDVATPRIHFFHTLEAGRYAHTSSTGTPGPVSLQSVPGPSIDLTGLLDELG